MATHQMQAILLLGWFNFFLRNALKLLLMEWSRTFSGNFAVLAYRSAVTLREEMTRLAQHAKRASRQLAPWSTSAKNECLLAMADALERNTPALQKANAVDLDEASRSGLST